MYAVVLFHISFIPDRFTNLSNAPTFKKVGIVSGDPPPYLPRSAMRRAISCSFMPTIASPRSSDSSAIILASV